jgi:hypothetical protein
MAFFLDDLAFLDAEQHRHLMGLTAIALQAAKEDTSDDIRVTTVIPRPICN